MDEFSVHSTIPWHFHCKRSHNRGIMTGSMCPCVRSFDECKKPYSDQNQGAVVTAEKSCTMDKHSWQANTRDGDSFCDGGTGEERVDSDIQRV